MKRYIVEVEQDDEKNEWTIQQTLPEEHQKKPITAWGGMRIIIEWYNRDTYQDSMLDENGEFVIDE